MKKGYKRLFYKRSNLLTEYIDGSLTESKKKKAESELFLSAQDKQRVNKLIELKKDLRALPKVETSPQFKILLHARLRKEQNARSKGFDILPLEWRLPAYAAASIALVGIGMVMGRWLYTPDSPSLVAAQKAPVTTAEPISQEPATESAPIKNYVVERVLVSELENEQSETLTLDRIDTTATRSVNQAGNQQLLRQASTSIQF